ncbi:MAG: glycoside hydrolase family 2 protein [Armatimonadota bacterium]
MLRYEMILALSSTFTLMCLGHIGAVSGATISMNGKWEAGREVYAEQPPSTWEETTVPGTPRVGPTAWLRRDFDLSDLDSSHCFILHFDMVNFACKVFVNGTADGEHFGGFTPFDIDITSFVRSGTNTVLVRVTDDQAIQGDYLIGAALIPPSSGTKAYIAPAGSTTGLWGIVGSVELRVFPQVYISDIYVKPSVACRSVSVEVTIRNTSKNDFHGSLSPVVADKGKEVLTFPTTEITASAGGETVVRVESISASKLTMWRPAKPKLYHLNADLYDDFGRVVHADKVRFGYREFGIDGERFRLNGIPIHLAASSLHLGDLSHDPKMVYEASKKSGVNILRLHGQPRDPEWYDLADEMGIMLVDESAIYGSYGNYAIGEPAFWENCRDHIRAWMRRDRNHPSVMIWSMSNEMGWDGKGKICYPEMRKLYDLMRTIDDTRPVLADGDGDAGGVLPITSLHYAEDYPGAMFPESAYWLEKTASFPNYYGNSPLTLRGKPLYIGEFSSDYFGYPNGPDIVGGDRAYLGNREMLALRGEIVRAFIEGYRWSGVAGIAPWTVFETGPIPNPYSEQHLTAYRQIALLLRDVDSRFFAGEVITRRMMALNDTLERRNLRLEWSLSQGDNILLSGNEQITLDPAEHRKLDINLRIPAVSKRTKLTFSAHLTADGKALDSIRKIYWAFPDIQPEKWPDRVEICLYDSPAGETSKCLSQLGLTAHQITAGELSSLEAPGLLIIGAGAADDSLIRRLPELERFVETGGVILSLEHGETMLRPGLERWGSTQAINFVRAPEHPVWRNPWRIGDDELRWWHGDLAVCDSMYLKPSKGAFRVLSDGGHGNKGTSFIEIISGKGRWLVTQLKLVTSFGSEPIASEILKRTLRYALNYAENIPVSPKVGVYADELLFTCLYKRDPSVMPLTGISERDLHGCSTLILGGRSFEGLLAVSHDQACSVIKRFAENGGTVYLKDLSAASERLLTELLPGITWEPVSAGEVVPDRTLFLQNMSTMVEKLVESLVSGVVFDPAPTSQIILGESSYLTDGIGNSDLRWVERGPGVTPSTHVIGTDLLKVPGARELTRPALLQEIRLGKGCIIIDQINWLGTPTEKAARVGATILTNLGIGAVAER